MLVYTSPSCAPCHTLKYWLDKKGISYKEVVGGARIYPTIRWGDNVIEGLNIPALVRLGALEK